MVDNNAPDEGRVDRVPPERADPQRLPPALRRDVDDLQLSVGENSTSYCGLFRLNPRFVVVPHPTNRPLISVPINIEALWRQFNRMILNAYVDWPTLRSLYTGDSQDITDSITLGCFHLASAMCLMVYNILRFKCSVHDSQNQSIYRSRCHLDIGLELPLGAAFIIEQFGFAKVTEYFDSPTFLHRWDHENSANNAFGLANNHALNNHLLIGFMQQLTRAGVNFRRVDKYCLPRTLWDSFYISGSDNSGYVVYTTYPIENYVLPRDVFIALNICGTSSLIAFQPVEFYPPRLCAFSRAVTTNNVKSVSPTTPSEATAAETQAMPSLTVAGNHAESDQLRINNALRNMHLTGTERVSGPPGADGNPTFTERIYIYGRGGASRAMLINCVARGVSPMEIDGYAIALFRHG